MAIQTPTHQLKLSYSLKPYSFTTHSPFTTLYSIQTYQKLKLSDSSTDPILSHQQKKLPSFQKKRLGVVVKPMEKPRIVLKLIWMEKAIGIGLDQVIPGGFGTIPLSPYYFWPRQDAWEQLKLLIENKPWISKRQMHLLLNQATDVINLWQEKGSKPF